MSGITAVAKDGGSAVPEGTSVVIERMFVMEVWARFLPSPISGFEIILKRSIPFAPIYRSGGSSAANPFSTTVNEGAYQAVSWADGVVGGRFRYVELQSPGGDKSGVYDLYNTATAGASSDAGGGVDFDYEFQLTADQPPLHSLEITQPQPNEAGHLFLPARVPLAKRSFWGLFRPRKLR